ncbi:ParB N-terminal domain-containing protein, partial [Rhodococcus hoagii]|nr:ParB N-terminal domain-containing protein [Prescottella equi]
ARRHQHPRRPPPDQGIPAVHRRARRHDPPTAVRTADGQLRVRTGHRRTAAAVHNGLAAIPVLVIGDEATDDAATLDRLATQWAENEHRTGLDHADKVDTVEQMSLLGVPAGQIAKRLKTTRAK